MMKVNKELEELIKTILEIRTEKEMHDFLLGILTPKELLEIPNRLEIVKMLKKGVPQHEIVSKLHVGIATVTRGVRELQKGRFYNV
ncbi:MAG: Trp family transcriptional regulator [Candidatus Levyibacteriota bacterium]